MDTFRIPEPDLYFRDGKPCIDPKVGLLNFGPNGLNEDNSEIFIGLIGSRSSNQKARKFMNRLRYQIAGEYVPNSNIRGIDFPGVDERQPLGFYYTIVKEFCEIISDDDINSILEKEKRKERVLAASKAYQQALKDLSEVHPGPSLVLISIPEKLLNKCANPWLKKKHIKLYNRSYRNLRKFSRIPVEERPDLFDFHNYLKVIAFQYNLNTQLILPSTLNFSQGFQDAATIAWNFVIANFYKSTGIPWKLADLEPETIHVGISFYNDIGNNQNPVVRAAIAQIYTRTGDSQVVRGLEIPIDKEEAKNRRPNLTKEQAQNILAKAIGLFKRQHRGQKPLRIVVHKKSNYTQNELIGFHEAAKGIEIQDYIHIYQGSNLRIITPTKYPIARGSVFCNSPKEFFIFTTGYISAFDTYPGSTVPIPLRIKIEDGETEIKQIATDIMNLTKLDWNTSNFANRLPVTISVSKKVGEIMGELTVTKKDLSLPPAYAYYM
ncbi:MAG: argonaute/piwi family protein [Candidatus Helarchaeota archaeon]